MIPQTTKQHYLAFVNFSDYYKNLKSSGGNLYQANVFRNKVMSLTHVTKKTFYNWVNGESSPTAAKRIIIENHFKQGFLYTTTEIKKVKIA